MGMVVWFLENKMEIIKCVIQNSKYFLRNFLLLEMKRVKYVIVLFKMYCFLKIR